MYVVGVFDVIGVLDVISVLGGRVLFTGRPILLSCGMTHGTTKEQMQQSIYAIHRAQLYMNPGEIYGQSTVIEVEPRKGVRQPRNGL